MAYLKTLLLYLHNDPDSLWVNLNHVTKLELAQAVHPSGHVCAQLEVLGQSLQLVHGEITTALKFIHIILIQPH